MSTYYPQGIVPVYLILASFPLKADPGSLAIAQDTGIVYEFSAATGTWVVVATPAGTSQGDILVSNLAASISPLGTGPSTIISGNLPPSISDFLVSQFLTGFVLAGDSNPSPLSTTVAMGGSTYTYSTDSTIMGFVQTGTTSPDGIFGFLAGPDTAGYMAPGDVMFGTYQGASTLRFKASGGIDVLTGKLTAVGGLGVGNSVAATTPGTVVKKIQIFDAAGVSLGFIAVYDTIS